MDQEDPGLPVRKDQRPLAEQEKSCAEWMNQPDWKADTNQYARNFVISRRGSFERLAIVFKNDTTYYLKGHLDSVKAACPLKQWLKPRYSKISLLSSTYYEFFNQLNLIPLIHSVTYGSWVNNSALKSLVESGVVKDLGPYEEMDTESIIQGKPDLVINFLGPVKENRAIETVRKLKVPVVSTSAWMENHPLGRAEWIKVIAWLTQRETEANEKYSKIVKNYTQLVDSIKVNLPQKKVKVIAASPYNDAWFVPAMDSYMGRLIQDAGALYLWDYPGTGSHQVKVEEAIVKALDADHWINLSVWSQHSDIPAPYNKIKAVKQKNIWSNNLRLTGSGGNDFYESGVFRVDLILRDLVQIFHEKNSNQFTYYKKLQ